jgi:predicted HAD superfamily Cof-like phosphohydrolase
MTADDIIQLRLALISEEFNEVRDAIYDYYLNSSPENLAAIAKEIADLHYVLYGTEEVLGIPGKQVFKEVHKNNMSKRINGKFVKREDGKILKGPKYKKADIKKVIFGNSN